MTRPGESLFRAIFEAQGLDVLKVEAVMDELYREDALDSTRLAMVERNRRIYQLRGRITVEVAGRFGLSQRRCEQIVKAQLALRRVS